MTAILMMSPKLAAVEKVFQNKVHDVLISVHDVINKSLSRESNYIVNVVMWLKFGNSSISLEKFIITSIL